MDFALLAVHGRPAVFRRQRGRAAFFLFRRNSSWWSCWSWSRSNVDLLRVARGISSGDDGHGNDSIALLRLIWLIFDPNKIKICSRKSKLCPKSVVSRHLFWLILFRLLKIVEISADEE